MKGKNSTPCIVAITAGFALTFSACRDASSEPKPLLPVHVANVEMVRSDSADAIFGQHCPLCAGGFGVQIWWLR
jgi:hypothetical protein